MEIGVSSTNLHQCRGTACNFNVDAAKAGKITIAEVEELVQPGDIHPGTISFSIVHCVWHP